MTMIWGLFIINIFTITNKASFSNALIDVSMLLIRHLYTSIRIDFRPRLNPRRRNPKTTKIASSSSG